MQLWLRVCLMFVFIADIWACLVRGCIFDGVYVLMCMFTISTFDLILHVYVYVCMCACSCALLCVCKMSLFLWLCTLTHVCVCICIGGLFVLECVNMYVCAFLFMNVCVLVCSFVCLFVCTCPYLCTSTLFRQNVCWLITCFLDVNLSYCITYFPLGHLQMLHWTRWGS